MDDEKIDDGIAVTYDKNLIKVLEVLHGVDAKKEILEMVIAGTEKELGRKLRVEEKAYIVLRENPTNHNPETFEYVISSEFKDSSERVLSDLTAINSRKKDFELDVLGIFGRASDNTDYIIKMYNARLDDILAGKRQMAILRRECDKLIEENIKLSERLDELEKELGDE